MDQVSASTYSVPTEGKVTGSTWTYGVRVLGIDGQPDSNTVTKTVTITGGSALAFAGLDAADVALAADYSALNLSWAAATNATGTVEYSIYGDEAFTKLIGETTATTFALPQPTPGTTYTLGVRARDDNGSDANTNLVVFPVAPFTYGGCQAATSASPGVNLVTFTIPAWASAVDIKRNGTSIALAASADQSPYTDSNAPTNAVSSYQCNAVIASGSEINGSKIVTAASAWKLRFAGLQTTCVTIAPDYSALNLTWSPATGGSGTVQYLVYGDSAFSQLIGTTNTPSWTIAQPTAGTSYTLGVRARDSIGTDGNTAIVAYVVPAKTYPSCTSVTAVSPGVNRVVFTIPAWATQVDIKTEKLLLNRINKNKIEFTTRVSDEPHHDGETVTLMIPGETLFGKGSVRLLPEAAIKIKKLASELHLVANVREIEVQGHTDSTKPGAHSDAFDNFTLSSERAGAVARLLIEGGVAPKLLSVRGMGDLRPLLPEHDQHGRALPENMAKNRRVQLVIHKEVPHAPAQR